MVGYWRAWRSSSAWRWARSSRFGWVVVAEKEGEGEREGKREASSASRVARREVGEVSGSGSAASACASVAARDFSAVGPLGLGLWLCLKVGRVVWSWDVLGGGEGDIVIWKMSFLGDDSLNCLLSLMKVNSLMVSYVEVCSDVA